VPTWTLAPIKNKLRYLWTFRNFVQFCDLIAQTSGHLRLCGSSSYPLARSGTTSANRNLPLFAIATPARTTDQWCRDMPIKVPITVKAYLQSRLSSPFKCKPYERLVQAQDAFDVIRARGAMLAMHWHSCPQYRYNWTFYDRVLHCAAVVRPTIHVSAEAQIG
jgi:hypothetical protein